MSEEEKEAYLQRISYRDYLLDVAKVHPEVLTLVGSVWALSQDTASAFNRPSTAGLRPGERMRCQALPASLA